MCDLVYYESLKRALKTKTIYGYRCDERLKTNVDIHCQIAQSEELKTFFDINSPLTASMLGGVAFSALALVGVTSVHAFVGSGGSVVLRWQTVQTLLPTAFTKTRRTNQYDQYDRNVALGQGRSSQKHYYYTS